MLEREKWASAQMDGVISSRLNPVWAPRTKKAYMLALKGFYEWLFKEGRRKDERPKAIYLRNYLEFLSHVTSGEYVVRIWKILRFFFRSDIQQDELTALDNIVQVLRMCANQRNPVKQRAADAVSLRELNDIMKKAQYIKLSRKEKCALEILSIAFVTMSRVAEICALEVRDIGVNGETLSF